MTHPSVLQAAKPPMAPEAEKKLVAAAEKSSLDEAAAATAAGQVISACASVASCWGCHAHMVLVAADAVPDIFSMLSFTGYQAKPDLAESKDLTENSFEADAADDNVHYGLPGLHLSSEDIAARQKET